MSVPALGGLLFGAIASSLFGGKSSGGSDYNYMPSQAAAAATPVVPKAPEDLAQGEDNAAAKAMEEAAEKERKEAAARQKANQSVFTSPLGAVGGATVARKQLLGA